MSQLVEQLVRRRKELGLSQTELAKRLGVPPPRISEFEAEKYDAQLSRVEAIAEALGCRCALVIE